MLRLAREQDRLRIVNDQFGCPTSAHELARCIWRVAARICDGAQPFRLWGTYHYAGAGATSWADFAAAIFGAPEARVTRPPAIDGVPTRCYPRPAIRPRNSALDCNKIADCLGLHPLPWQAPLAEVLGRLHMGADA
jgi:dTDP-4-dehydrorhamnose reductase